ncbi:MAG: O-antigen ligase family protein, partial [Alphaproteobacteria bacterium]|nr:O-antigen ligase family protein [Alphaproteobacteria bacterium]
MLSSRLNFITLILLSLLGVGIQTQILFGVTDTYMGLRLNLGDFVIPCAGALILLSLFLKQSRWPKWQTPCNDVWFFALLGAIVMGLVNAYLQYGNISNWAVLNRGIGWGVLTGYIFFAGWCVTNLSEKTIFTYLRFFLLFTLGTIILGVVWFLLTQYGTRQGGNANYQALSGFMGNRNAFAFLMLCVVVIYTYFDDQKINIASKMQLFLTHALWGALPIAMMFNGSRAGWIGTAMIIVLFLITKFKYTLQFVLPALILSLVVIGGMYTQNPQNVFREFQGNKLVNLGTQDITQKTDTLRITVAKDALELWSDHKIFGAGIGGFLIFQEEKRGAALD